MNYIGAEWHDKVVKVVDPNYRITHHTQARVSGRLLEETVELCMACGLSPEKILGHVMDAIHNESMKAKLYPTEMQPEINFTETSAELTDVYILQRYLAHQCGVSQTRIEDAATGKLHMFEDLAKSNSLVLRDGLIYKKGKYHEDGHR